jgi:alpha-tubulin suppressor-like RCC1 family protein
VKEYLIYKNDESEPLAVLKSNIMTYKAVGLTGETNYTFKVIAKDYSGNLSVALTNSVKTAVDDVNPTWPANAFLNAKDLKSDSFTIYWQAALDNVTIGSYNVYKDGELIGTVDGTITEYEITGLEATTKYNFMVEAEDTNGNKTVDKLAFEQSTTVSGPTEGSGIAFSMVAPQNENVGKSGNVMINRVTESLLDTNVSFEFNFEKEIEADTWLSNIELINNEEPENPIELKAEYFTYTFENGTGSLNIAIPQEIVDMGASYQLKLKSLFEANDGSTLGRDYIWEFNVSEGLYGIKDIATGMNCYSAWEAEADRFYLMLKTDGTVWGWGNNLYGHLGNGTTQDSDVPIQALNLENIVKVIAGRESAFAIDANGVVWSWGSNEFGQLGRGVLPLGTSGRYGNETPQKIEGLPPITDLVYGFQRVVALDVNGDVWTWGFRTYEYQSPYGVLSTGTPSKVESLSNIVDIATGYTHSLAVSSDGKVLDWEGIDDTPAEVSGLSEVKSVACDSFNYTKNNLALKKDGTVWYWGEGTKVVTIPGPSNKLVVDLIMIDGAEKIREIYPNSLTVLTNDRSVRRINVNFEEKTAALGDVVNNMTDISKLADYTSGSRTNPISGGLALKLDGTLVQYIDNTVTPIELGMDVVEPPAWPEDSAVTFTNRAENGLTVNWNSCGNDVSAYALYQDGSLVTILPGNTLSYNITGLTKGQEYTYKVKARFVGSSYTENGPTSSVTLSDWNPAMQGADKIAAGDGHTLMIDAEGNVWAWGSNEFGQLGIGSNEDKTNPCKIDGLNSIKAVAVGDNHSLALDSEGNVWVWGKNDKFQLGLGTIENSNVPVKLTTISDVKEISAAGNYNLAVKKDGTLWSWGEACMANLSYAISGIDGQTPGRMKYGTPRPSVNYYYENVKSATASRNFYAVLFADGTISRSGYFIDRVGARTYWTMLSNPGLMGVQAISAGDDFLMALLEDGTVAVLGDNSQGQYGNGTRINPTPATPVDYAKVIGLDNVVAISAGGAHGLALKEDGSVWGWGQNNKGQLGNGNVVTQLLPKASIGLAGINAIDAGSLYSIALKDDVTTKVEAYSFGINDRGQLGNGNTISNTDAKRILFEGNVDTVAPTFPAWFAIYVTELTNDSATVMWSEAQDDTDVELYEIWQNNIKVGQVTADERTFTVTGLKSGNAYEIGIKAVDTTGNTSSLSETIRFETKSEIDKPGNTGNTTGDITGNDVETTINSKGTMTVETKVDSTGKTTASVSESQVKEAIDKAVEVAKKQGTDLVLEIKVNTTTTATTVETTIPEKSIADIADNNVKTFVVDTSLTNIVFDKKAIETIKDQVPGDLKITVAKVDNTTLSSEAKNIVGDRPVFDISVITNGKKVTDFRKGKLTISAPYTLKNGERAENVVVYYINDSGILEKMADAQYDEKTQTITFTTNHLSYYAIGYEDKPVGGNFVDVAKDAWYATDVNYLADRRIISGRGDGCFAPNDKITRAEFATILAKMSEEDLSKFTQTNFKDVKADDWFIKPVAWASKRGIAKGGTDGKYNPQANISRQEMAAMLCRYRENISKKAFPEKNQAIVFADQSKIADYAKESVAVMQKAGIICGRGNNLFAPLDGATRAETARMIAEMMQLK